MYYNKVWIWKLCVLIVFYDLYIWYKPATYLQTLIKPNQSKITEYYNNLWCSGVVVLSTFRLENDYDNNIYFHLVNSYYNKGM